MSRELELKRTELEATAWDAMLKVTEAVADSSGITPELREQSNAALAAVDRWWNCEVAQ